MRKRVYVETSVVSYFVAKPSRDLVIAGHQEATRELWPRFATNLEPFISALVYQEAGKGDPGESRHRLEVIKTFQLLDIDDECRVLAERIIDGQGIPAQFRRCSPCRGCRREWNGRDNHMELRTFKQSVHADDHQADS